MLCLTVITFFVCLPWLVQCRPSPCVATPTSLFSSKYTWRKNHNHPGTHSAKLQGKSIILRAGIIAIADASVGFFLEVSWQAPGMWIIYWWWTNPSLLGFLQVCLQGSVAQQNAQEDCNVYKMPTGKKNDWQSMFNTNNIAHPFRFQCFFFVCFLVWQQDFETLIWVYSESFSIFRIIWLVASTHSKILVKLNHLPGRGENKKCFKKLPPFWSLRDFLAAHRSRVMVGTWRVVTSPYQQPDSTHPARHDANHKANGTWLETDKVGPEPILIGIG